MIAARPLATLQVAQRRVAGRALLCLLALVVLAMLGEVDVIATGEGRVIPTSRVKRIQPVEPGQVIALHVDDGDRVRSGGSLGARCSVCSRSRCWP